MDKKIIVWDFSGIQSYLFDIRKNKSATKRLKWRSLFIEFLLEKIKEGLKEKLGAENFIDENLNEKSDGKLKNENWKKWDYLVSGGKFILICNNFDEKAFKEFKKDIENKLFKQFYWELKIIFWISDWDCNENSFKIALAKAYENVEKNKLKAFETVLIDNWKWNEKEFVFSEDRWPSKVCKFSRDRLINKEMTEIIENEIWKDFFSDEDKGISYKAWLDLLITKAITKEKLDLLQYINNWKKRIKKI